jgi:hypothetical protein
MSKGVTTGTLLDLGAIRRQIQVAHSVAMETADQIKELEEKYDIVINNIIKETR